MKHKITLFAQSGEREEGVDQRRTVNTEAKQKGNIFFLNNKNNTVI